MVLKCSQFPWSLQRIPFTGHRTLFHVLLSMKNEETFRNNWKMLNLQMINNKVNTVRVLFTFVQYTKQFFNFVSALKVMHITLLLKL